jgi:arylsulfatase A-like enzyme
MNSYGSGKLYHPFQPPYYDSSKSWSLPSLPYSNPCYFFGISCLPCAGFEQTCSQKGFGPGNHATCWCKVEAVEDRLTVDRGLELMSLAAKQYKWFGKRFYLAIGLHKPHQPFQAQKKHFDMYPLKNVTVAKYKTAQKGQPDVAIKGSQESVTPWEPIDDHGAQLARRAYYASITGMDEQLGRVLKGLKKQGLEDNTVVLFHSDHGYELGEFSMWGKNSNFELGTRVPFIIRPPPNHPAFNKRKGERESSFAELVDLMPTMAEFAGIDLNKMINPAKEAPLGG